MLDEGYDKLVADYDACAKAIKTLHKEHKKDVLEKTPLL